MIISILPYWVILSLTYYITKGRKSQEKKVQAEMGSDPLRELRDFVVNFSLTAV